MDNLPDWWPFLVSMATLLLSFIGGVASVPAINWLKEQLSLSGRQVYILVWVVSILIAIASVIVDGTLTPGGMDWEKAGVIVVTVITASQAEYQRIKGASRPVDADS